MPDIPDYMRDFDLNVDYGFTSVAKPPTKVVEKTDDKTAAVVEKTTSAVESNKEEIKKIQDDTKDIKSYLSEVMQVLNETNVSSSKDLATRKIELDKRYSKKFKDIEKVVFPLLYNLMKSDEPYIHWPNRKPIIQGQIEKILKITREQ